MVKRLCLVASIQSLALCFIVRYDQRQCSLALILSDVEFLGLCTSDAVILSCQLSELESNDDQRSTLLKYMLEWIASCSVKQSSDRSLRHILYHSSLLDELMVVAKGQPTRRRATVTAKGATNSSEGAGVQIMNPVPYMYAHAKVEG